MELKKTTILSAFVVVSGILAEIIFRDIFSKSFAGVALSIALAVVVLAAFYFTVDGIYSMASLYKERASERQKEYEQRVYNVLNEQLKFQKVVYGEVKNLQQQVTEQKEKMSELSGISANTLKNLADLQKIHDTPNQTNEDLTKIASEMDQGFQRLPMAVKEQLSAEMREEAERLLADIGGRLESISAEMKDQSDKSVSQINDHTMQAAKVIAKFVGKNTEEIKMEIHNR